MVSALHSGIYSFLLSNITISVLARILADNGKSRNAYTATQVRWFDSHNLSSTSSNLLKASMDSFTSSVSAPPGLESGQRFWSLISFVSISFLFFRVKLRSLPRLAHGRPPRNRDLPSFRLSVLNKYPSINTSLRGGCPGLQPGCLAITLRVSPRRLNN